MLQHAVSLTQQAKERVDVHVRRRDGAQAMGDGQGGAAVHLQTICQDKFEIWQAH